MSEKRITRAGELGRQALGPLPEGWAIEGGFINYGADGYCKYILDKSGRLDRNSIALTLENYGYADHARRWFLSPVEMAAPDLLEALKAIIAEWRNYGDSYFRSDLATDAIAAIAKAEERPIP